MAKRISGKIKHEAILMADTGIRFWEIGQHLKVSGESVRRWWHRWEDGVLDVRRCANAHKPHVKWNVYDTVKRRFVGKGYATEKEADEALYEFL